VVQLKERKGRIQTRTKLLQKNTNKAPDFAKKPLVFTLRIIAYKATRVIAAACDSLINSESRALGSAIFYLSPNRQAPVLR
jgi:hypothetical protein